MQQRQPRLGDILDDYCPRERRVTNHAVVAMVGPDVKQTRCTTCDAEHDFKHAKVPRQRKKSDSPAVLYAQVLAGGPKKVVHDVPGAVATAPPAPIHEHATQEHSIHAQAVHAQSVHSRDIQEPDDEAVDQSPDLLDSIGLAPVHADSMFPAHADSRLPAHADSRLPAHADSRLPAHADSMLDDDDDDDEGEEDRQPVEEGPVHRRLIRAQLPRIEGQPAQVRQAPDFTIRQPAAGRVNRFRGRNQRPSGGGQFQGPSSRSNGSGMGGGSGMGNSGVGPMRSGSQGHGSHGQGSQGHGSQGHGSQGHGSQGNGSQGNNGGGRPPMASRPAKRQGPGGRKRSK